MKSTAAELREASKHAFAIATTSSAKLKVKPENSVKKKASEIVREFGLIQLLFYLILTTSLLDSTKLPYTLVNRNT